MVTSGITNGEVVEALAERFGVDADDVVGALAVLCSVGTRVDRDAEFAPALAA